MSRVILDIKTEDLSTLRDGDILVFNAEKNYFYKKTAQEFWKQHNDELAKIIKRYDDVVTKFEASLKALEEKENKFEESVLKHEVDFENAIAKILAEHKAEDEKFQAEINRIVKELEQDNENTSKKLNLSLEEYLGKSKAITTKLVGMVETFIKTGGIK